MHKHGTVKSRKAHQPGGQYYPWALRTSAVAIARRRKHSPARLYYWVQSLLCILSQLKEHSAINQKAGSTALPRVVRLVEG
jgi:hypothetical protein